jgi:hypothetical protein
MAMAATSPQIRVLSPTTTYRRVLAFAFAAVALVGGTAVTTAVIVDDDSGTPAAAPAPALSDFDVRRSSGSLTVDDMENHSTPSDDPLVIRYGADATPFAQQRLMRLSGPR